MSYPSKDQLKDIAEYIGSNLHLPQLVQHFDKSNIYDTDEKLIGQWIDGKPLYQKTFKTVVPTTSANGTEVAGSVISIGTSVDQVFLKDAFVHNANGTVHPLPNSKLSNNANQVMRIVIQSNKSTSNKNTFLIYNSWLPNNGSDCYVTLNYTKTTDSPLTYKLGTENDYSTEERLIGTWIDGKPVYQKTMIITSPSTGDGASEYYNVGALVDSFVSIDPYINVKGTYINVNSAFAGDPSDSKFMRITGRTNAQTDNPNTIRIQNWTAWVDCQVFCTIKYTKV